MPVITVNLGTAFADFNMVDERGRLLVSRRYFIGLSPSAGRVIHLRDHEGNGCDALIERVRPRVIETRPYLDTWTDAPQHAVTIERSVNVPRLVGSSSAAAVAPRPALA